MQTDGYNAWRPTAAWALLFVCLAAAAAASPLLPDESGAAAQPTVIEPAAGASPLVTVFDLTECARVRLPEFAVRGERAVWGAGLLLLLQQPATGRRLDLTVGIHGSPEEAAAAARALAADLSVRLESGSLTGVPLGGGSWSSGVLEPDKALDSPGPALVLFHRDNVVVRVFGTSPAQVQSLAETIDRDLLAGATFVRRGEALDRPTLTCAVSRKALVPDEEWVEGAGASPAEATAQTAEDSDRSGAASDKGAGAQASAPAAGSAGAPAFEIRVSASIPSSRKVRYAYLAEGGSILGGDPPQPLSFTPYGSGPYRLEIQAVDDRCVVSRVLDVPLGVVGEK